VTLIDASMNTRRLVRRLAASTLDAAVSAGRLARHYCGGIELAEPEVCEDDEDEDGGFVFISDAQVKMLAICGKTPPAKSLSCPSFHIKCKNHGAH
jgi:hypothetical protein